jgi:hypothetical protein
MEMLQQCTEDERRLLLFAPLWVFCAVADADDHIDEDEMAALAQEVEGAEEFSEPLVREVFSALRRDNSVLQAFRAGEQDTDQGLAKVADLLARKAAPGHAEAFKRALVYVGRRVAMAAVDNPFSRQRVSGQEQLVLFRVADILGVSVE